MPCRRYKCPDFSSEKVVWTDQEQFAAKLGVTVVTVNLWENYRNKPMPLALRQLQGLLIKMS